MLICFDLLLSLVLMFIFIFILSIFAPLFSSPFWNCVTNLYRLICLNLFDCVGLAYDPLIPRNNGHFNPNLGTLFPPLSTIHIFTSVRKACTCFPRDLIFSYLYFHMIVFCSYIYHLVRLQRRLYWFYSVLVLTFFIPCNSKLVSFFVKSIEIPFYKRQKPKLNLQIVV